MSDISLKAYKEEIDQLIDASRYLEALAHLRYILSQYPRYVEAYYQLGKMLLEADLPDFAADMFRRVLAVDPEHLEARIGLGLAHQQKNNLDAAIWNLERALELAPESIEIMDELQQLYEERDGAAPDRLFRTRAGLARLYLRARLYGRAARELRALLTEDPARPDLMTALAEAYWRDGQTVQAADLCQEILDKMPYHCKANLILGSLWVNSGQNEGWSYLRRAEEVDPENQRALALLGEADVVEPHTVTLEHLDYDPDALDVDQGSEWFKKLSSMSIEMGVSEVSPEMTGEEMRLADITASLEAQIELPDWLRDLGLGEEEKAGPTEAPAAEMLPTVEVAPPEEGTGEEAAEGESAGKAAGVLAEEAPAPSGVEEAPDWLLELVEEAGGEAPAPPAESAEPVSPDVSEEGWLEALQTVVSGELEPEEPPEDEAGSWEDWDIGPTAEAEEIATRQEEEIGDLLAELGPLPAPTEGTAAPEQGEPPDWLAELETEGLGEEAPAPAGPESLPDWLSELQPSVGDVDATLVGETEEQEIADLVEEILGEEEAPDWLSELEMEPDLGAGPETVLMEPAPATAEGEAELEALVGEAAVEGIETQEGPGTPVELELEGEEPPTRELEVSPTQVEGLVSEEEAVEAPTPTVEGATGEILPGDAALAWLEGLVAGHEEELRAQVEAEAEARMAELLGREKPEEAAPPEETPSEMAPPAETVIEERAEEAETEAAVEEAAVQEAAVPEPAVPEPVVEEPVAEAEAVPEAVAPPTEVAPEVEQEGEGEAEDALAWLESLATAGEAVGEEAPAEGIAAPPVEPVEMETAAEPETGGELLSGEDALAWLESLASGHEEELRAQVEAEAEARMAELLGREKPEETAAEAAAAEAAAAEAVAEEETMPAEEVIEERAEEAETEAAVEEPAVEEPAVEEPAVEEPAVEEPAVEEPAVEEPAVKEPAVKEPAVKEPAVKEPAVEQPAAAAQEIVAEEEAAPEAVAPPTEVAPEVEPEQGAAFVGWTAFGDGIVGIAPSEPMPEAALTEESETPIEEAAPTEDALAWLEGLPPEKEAVLEAEIAPPVEAEVGAVPSEAEGLEAAVEEEGEIPPAPEETVPPMVEAETIPKAEVEAEAEVPSPAPEAVSLSMAELEELRARVKRKRSDHEARLTLARALWEMGEIEESMTHYGRLIKSGARGEEVQQDLERYVQMRPDDPRILKTLGDVYMKFGDLEQALAIYNQAMDLL